MSGEKERGRSEWGKRKDCEWGDRDGESERERERSVSKERERQRVRVKRWINEVRERGGRVNGERECGERKRGGV